MIALFNHEFICTIFIKTTKNVLTQINSHSQIKYKKILNDCENLYLQKVKTVNREFLTKNYVLSLRLQADIFPNDGRLCISLPILNNTICINVVKF